MPEKSCFELIANPATTQVLENLNYKGLSEEFIRNTLKGVVFQKIEDLLPDKRLLIVRNDWVPSLIVCLMDSNDVCIRAYMLS